MKKLDIKKKRILKFYKTPINPTESTYSLITDSSIILISTELCKLYNLELLSIYRNGEGKTAIVVNGQRDNFNLFVAGICKEFANKIGSVEF